MNSNKFIVTIFLALILGFFSDVLSQDNEEREHVPENTYDPALAAAYGADDYGMRKFVMAFLYKGDNTEVDSARSASLQMAHLENITRMAREGKLVLAGPFFGNGDLRGIYIFNIENLKEAEVLTGSDPAIQAGVLRMELLEWYGSAALVGLNEISEKVTKKKITDR